VFDATQENIALVRATGFSFKPHAPFAFAEALGRCLMMYHHHPTRWKNLQQTGMLQDWSWQRSAAEYERLYQQLLHEA
jgi:starch synthase